MRFVKRMAVCLSGLIISGSVLPNVAKASETDIHIVTTEQRASRSLKEITGNNEVYRGKTPQERSQLPADERALVEALEDYIKSQVNLNSRSITELLLNRLFVDFAFDFGFNRDNQVFATLASAGSAGGEDIFGPYVEWFDKLGNKELRTMTVYDKPTKKMFLLSRTTLIMDRRRRLCFITGIAAIMSACCLRFSFLVN